MASAVERRCRWPRACVLATPSEALALSDTPSGGALALPLRIIHRSATAARLYTLGSDGAVKAAIEAAAGLVAESPPTMPLTGWAKAVADWAYVQQSSLMADGLPVRMLDEGGWGLPMQMFCDSGYFSDAGAGVSAAERDESLSAWLPGMRSARAATESARKADNIVCRLVKCGRTRRRPRNH
eukprot:6564750-Prymnesium_polylepis.2